MKNFLKKILTVLFAACLAVSFAACGGNGNSNSNSSANDVSIANDVGGKIYTFSDFKVTYGKNFPSEAKFSVESIEDFKESYKNTEITFYFDGTIDYVLASRISGTYSQSGSTVNLKLPYDVSLVGNVSGNTIEISETTTQSYNGMECTWTETMVYTYTGDVTDCKTYEFESLTAVFDTELTPEEESAYYSYENEWFASSTVTFDGDGNFYLITTSGTYSGTCSQSGSTVTGTMYGLTVTAEAVDGKLSATFSKTETIGGKTVGITQTVVFGVFGMPGTNDIKDFEIFLAPLGSSFIGLDVLFDTELTQEEKDAYYSAEYEWFMYSTVTFDDEGTFCLKTLTDTYSGTYWQNGSKIVGIMDGLSVTAEIWSGSSSQLSATYRKTEMIGGKSVGITQTVIFVRDSGIGGYSTEDLTLKTYEFEGEELVFDVAGTELSIDEETAYLSYEKEWFEGATISFDGDGNFYLVTSSDTFTGTYYYTQESLESGAKLIIGAMDGLNGWLIYIYSGSAYYFNGVHRDIVDVTFYKTETIGGKSARVVLQVRFIYTEEFTPPAE